jgi:hypothetical protein
MKKLFSKVGTALAVATVGASQVFAQSDFGQAAPERIGSATGGTGDFKSLLLTIINYFLGFLGVLAVLMVIYGGVLYITASGDPQKADKGKKIIMYAIIGIVIILLSFALINTVLGAALGGTGGGQ